MLSDCEERIRSHVAPYHAYFITSEVPQGSLPAASISLSLIVLGIVFWGLKTYLEAFLKKRGELDAASFSDDAKPPISTEPVRLEVTALLVQAGIHEYDASSVPETEIVAERLQQLGLTQSIAQRCAQDIRDELQFLIKEASLGGTSKEGNS